MSKTAQNQINQIDLFSTLPDELLYLISEKLENVGDRFDRLLATLKRPLALPVKTPFFSHHSCPVR